MYKEHTIAVLFYSLFYPYVYLVISSLFYYFYSFTVLGKTTQAQKEETHKSLRIFPLSQCIYNALSVFVSVWLKTHVISQRYFPHAYHESMLKLFLLSLFVLSLLSSNIILITIVQGWKNHLKVVVIFCVSLIT